MTKKVEWGDLVPQKKNFKLIYLFFIKNIVRYITDRILHATKIAVYHEIPRLQFFVIYNTNYMLVHKYFDE
jgi:hypothetical protein